jgi:hypothetical protein
MASVPASRHVGTLVDVTSSRVNIFRAQHALSKPASTARIAPGGKKRSIYTSSQERELARLRNSSNRKKVLRLNGLLPPEEGDYAMEHVSPNSSKAQASRDNYSTALLTPPKLNHSVAVEPTAITAEENKSEKLTSDGSAGSAPRTASVSLIPISAFDPGLSKLECFFIACHLQQIKRAAYNTWRLTLILLIVRSTITTRQGATCQANSPRG